MDEASAQVFVPPREQCFERLRRARFGATVTCLHCTSDEVVKRGTTGKDAQQYWCKDCETYFNDLTNTIFGQHRFGLEEMFYIVKEMRSEPPLRSLVILTGTTKLSLTSSTKCKMQAVRSTNSNSTTCVKPMKST